MPRHRIVSAVIPCFRDAQRAIKLVHALARQELPPSWALEIVVIDDGSGDGSDQTLQSGVGAAAKVISLTRNQGRASARARGIMESNGEVVVLIDCDCLPGSPRFIQQHLATLAQGTVASIGGVEGSGRGFWHRYQSEASSRRFRLFRAGVQYAGSGANIAVRRDALVRSGGLDTRYVGYGFEDRALLLRLSEVGSIAWTTDSDAVVRHMDTVRLQSICHKMEEAGRTASTNFLTEYPVAYRELGYASVDVRLRPALRPLALLSGWLVFLVAKTIDPLLEHLPYPFAKTLVKIASGGAYLYGTSRAIPFPLDT